MTHQQHSRGYDPQWEETLKPKLAAFFHAEKKKHLGELGEIVDGGKVEGICGFITGIKLSKLGIALLVERNSIPFYILGVSKKYYIASPPHSHPIVLYELILKPADKHDDNERTYWHFDEKERIRVQHQYNYSTHGFGFQHPITAEYNVDDFEEILKLLERKFLLSKHLLKLNRA